MTGSMIVELKPSSELMLGIDALVTALNRLSDVMEAHRAPDTSIPAPVTPLRRSAPRPVPDAGPAVSMDFENIRIWAATRGIDFRTWDDLTKVNEKRESLGQPIIKRVFR